jgi:hypothetical protein
MVALSNMEGCKDQMTLLVRVWSGSGVSSNLAHTVNGRRLQGWLLVPRLENGQQQEGEIACLTTAS